MPWNMGPHKRKFLISAGRYVQADGRRREGEVVFWGEWELPSHVERRWSREGGLPQVLHRKATSMQRLSPGSVICFGSRLDHEFRVDTVFVVAEAESWTPAQAAGLDEDEAFMARTAEPMAAGASDQPGQLAEHPRFEAAAGRRRSAGRLERRPRAGLRCRSGLGHLPQDP